MVVKQPWTDLSGAQSETSGTDPSLPGWASIGQTAEIPTQVSGTDLQVDNYDTGLHDMFGRDYACDVVSNTCGGESVSVAPSVAETEGLLRHVSANISHAVRDHADVSSSSFDTVTALEVASRSIPMQSVEPIWEQGIWGVNFGNKTMLDVYKPYGETLKRPADSTQPSSELGVALPASTRHRGSFDSGLSFADVVKYKPDISWQEQRDSNLQRSVKFWMALVDRWDSKCSLCHSIGELGSTSRIFTRFAHLFAGRAPITFLKRAYSVMRVCDYLENVVEVFPCSECLFYDFLCSEQLSNAPQSRLKGYLQSMNFVRFVMSVEELAGLTTSARCKGACLGVHVQERVQASPLTVGELKRFHQLLLTGDDVWIRMFCGAIVMAVYCRSRWGDLMRAEAVIADRDRDGLLCYLEARTGRHKTMKSQIHRHRSLPMVAPACGIDGSNWGLAWLDVRRQLGIAWPPEGLIMSATRSTRHPNMQAFGNTGLCCVAQEDGVNDVIVVKDEPETIEDSEPEDGLDSSSTSSEEPRPTKVRHFPVVQPTVAPDCFFLGQHKKLKTLHLMEDGYSKVFACGRSVGSLHEKLKEAPQFDTPLCSSCFNRRQP